ncbi:hypothetical protein DL93DRAFT_2156967 [Clavulina sp. PMI_390]|nr:hypothetical protein DL93DRAFT_2156967 [Clavulina sp. PMI_390]
MDLNFKMAALNIPADDPVDLQGMGGEGLALGQLKNMSPVKTRPQQYAMRYEDEDGIFEELEEFLSYQEVQQLSYNVDAWDGSFRGVWSKAPIASKRSHVEVLLESLEHKDADLRLANIRKLLYIIQGTFAESTSPEQHLHLIIENCKIVRAANGFSLILSALKVCNAKHDLVCNLSEVDVRRLNITEGERQESLLDLEWEISCYCNMLYFMVQIFKGDDEFGDELMTSEPPFPHFMFSMLSGIREKSVKTYPVKKVLLLTYKAQLTCFGGVRELARAKKLARELANLPSLKEEPTVTIKSSPIDFKQFHTETSVKYPTFAPNTFGSVNTDTIAVAIQPIPVRPNFHSAIQEEDSMGGLIPQRQQAQQVPQQLPPTPAPSPPPNAARLKKEKYQTDPNRPFLFPFSRNQTGLVKMVPFAVDEADRLYRKHMHISLALFQMWQTREAYILDDSGIDPYSPQGIAQLDREAANIFGSAGPKPKAPPSDPDAIDGDVPLPDIAILEAAIAEAQAKLEKAEKEGDRTAIRKLKERRDDLVRLRRVESYYAHVLPLVQAWVLVVLRIVLNTIRTETPGNAAGQNQGGFPASVADLPQPPPTLDEIDRERHREISLKGVSGLMLNTLKWMKVSHCMKFQHFGAILVESNITLLILKAFGIQEMTNFLQAKNDSHENNFFQYCYRTFNPDYGQGPEDAILSAPRKHPAPIVTDGDDIEYITDFSWRNFFSTISFVKVLQKLTKGRSFRIGMLVSYKSSAIMKRMLKVAHPVLQLHVLKLIKSQVPSCPKKWRQTNMKVITSIYLNCRPDLRDEWLAGNEPDETSDAQAQAQENALRQLIRFYNTKRYGSVNPLPPTNLGHRRTTSQSVAITDPHLTNPDMHNINRPPNSPSLEQDVFPPLRSRVSDPSSFVPYTTDDNIGFEEDYEDYLQDLSSEDLTGEPPFPGFWAHEGGGALANAWHRVEHIASGLADDISDSESVVSIGDLGDEDRHDGTSSESDGESVDQNVNNWEHMSPKTFKAMPKSPASGRRSSSGSGLRPVVPFGLDDGSAIEEDFDEIEVGGPVPREGSQPFAAGEGGKGVDEVEYMYNE